MASTTPRYQTPASRRRQPPPPPPPQKQYALTLTSTPSPSLPPHTGRFPRSHSNPILPSTALPVSLPSAWCHPPADIAAHICQHLPLPSLLTLSTLSRHYNLLLSHPIAFRLPCLSLSLHHSLHSFLSSLLPSQQSTGVGSSSHRRKRRDRPHSLFSRLQHVDISHSLYSASSLAFLTHCTALRTLRLHQSQYDPANLTRLTTALTHSPHLHSLQLSSVRVCNEWMTAVATLPVLTCLDLHGTVGYDGSALRQLRRLTALRVLNLEGSECVDDNAIHALLGQQSADCTEVAAVEGGGCSVFGELSVLRLSSGVTDVSLRLLAVECRQLTSLSLTGCRLISMSGVAALAESLHSLTSLGLSRCPLLFPLPPTAVLSSTAVSAAQSSPVCAAPLPALFPHFPSLSLLTLSFITDTHLTHLLSTHPHLSHLALSSHSLTSACFPALLSASQLTELGLSLWGRGRRDLLFSRRIRDIVRRWGKELRGGMVMVEGGEAVCGMVGEVVEGMKRGAVEGEWMEEKEEEEVDEWPWTQSGRLKPHLGQWL